MALLYIEGFENLATGTADLAEKNWTTGGFNVAAGGRRGGQCAVSATASGYLRRGIPLRDTLFVGFAFQPMSTATLNTILALSSPDTIGSDHIRLIYNGTTGIFSLYRGGTTIPGTISVPRNSGWHYIEVGAYIHDTLGWAKVIIDGITHFDLINVDTRYSTYTATIGYLDLGGNYVNPVSDAIDDIYILDNTGTSNNTFLGDCRVDAVLPNGAGSSTMFLPLSGLNYTNVDETTIDGDTSYNYSSTINDLDLYAMADPPAIAGSTIFGVQTTAIVRKDDTGSRTAAVVTKSGATTAVGTSFAPGTGYGAYTQVLDTDPNTTAAWTDAALAALECGVKVTG